MLRLSNIMNRQNFKNQKNLQNQQNTCHNLVCQVICLSILLLDDYFIEFDSFGLVCPLKKTKLTNNHDNVIVSSNITHILISTYSSHSQKHQCAYLERPYRTFNFTTMIFLQIEPF